LRAGYKLSFSLSNQCVTFFDHRAFKHKFKLSFMEEGIRDIRGQLAKGVQEPKLDLSIPRLREKALAHMLDAHAHVVATMSESIKQGYEKAGTMKVGTGGEHMQRTDR
jgi:hypothetical protein